MKLSTQTILRLRLPILLLRLIFAAVLVPLITPVSIDDYFRIFHAAWWWNHVSFTTSHEWLPGYAYFYGVVVGLFRDMLLAPKIATAVLHILCGVVILYFEGGASAKVRIFAAIWILFSPLMLVLGSVPLSETIYILMIVSGITAMRRYLVDGRVLGLLAAAIFYFGATMIRYEAWLLLPIYTWMALSKAPEDAALWLGKVLAFLPWMFPFIWIIFLGVVTGEPLLFLSSVQTDHFGPSDILGIIHSPQGYITCAQLLLLMWPLARFVIGFKEGSRTLISAIWEIHVLVLFFGVIVIVVFNNVPSQFPIRILAPLLVFGAVPLGNSVAAINPAARRIFLVLASMIFVSSIGAVLTLNISSRMPMSDIEAGNSVNDAFTSGDLGSGDHVLVENELPFAAAVYVFSNQIDNVHIDAMGGNLCPAIMLTFYDNTCPLPDWSPFVQKALVRNGGAGCAYLEELGWVQENVMADWISFRRPKGSPYPGQVRRVRTIRDPGAGAR